MRSVYIHTHSLRMWQLLMKSSQIQLVLILIYGICSNNTKQLTVYINISYPGTQMNSFFCFSIRISIRFLYSSIGHLNQFSEQQRPDQVVDSFKWIQFSCQILALASGSHLGHNVTICVVDVIAILYPKLEKCSQLSLTYDSSNSNNNMLACLFIAKINVYRFSLFVCITLYY